MRKEDHVGKIGKMRGEKGAKYRCMIYLGKNYSCPENEENNMKMGL